MVLARLKAYLEPRSFSPDEWRTLSAFSDVLLAQHSEPRLDVLAYVDAKLQEAGGAAWTASSTMICPATRKSGIWWRGG